MPKANNVIRGAWPEPISPSAAEAARLALGATEDTHPLISTAPKKGRRPKPTLNVGLRMTYNDRMDNDDGCSPNELLNKYESGVWIFLIVVAAAILGLILWLGYMVFL